MARHEHGAGQKRKKRRVRPEAVCFMILITAFVFYGITKIGLYSYNISLQQQEQDLAAQIKEKQTSIEDLQAQVHNMQDKSRVLDLLGNSLQDNAENVHIIDSDE